MMLRLGSVVFTPKGRGVVSDRCTAAAESLVRLDRGSVLDTTHGQWFPDSILAPCGFRPDAEVWFAGRIVPASATIRKV